ncbi:MAG: hypothetical protein KAH18_10660 [Psychromonas sp.]|nr:hypothetical protein [Psychromonas sp.]
MGPLIPSITLTDPIGKISMIYDNVQVHPAWYGVDGTTVTAMTTRGRLVNVWKPNPNNSINTRYFCHGHTLGTYFRYGYSVCSYSHILTALEDECVEICAGQTTANAIKEVINGDIVSFSDLIGNIMHSALVVKAPMAIQSLNVNSIFEEIKVWTKNGRLSLCIQSLITTCNVYNYAPILRYWRAR